MAMLALSLAGSYIGGAAFGAATLFGLSGSTIGGFVGSALGGLMSAKDVNLTQQGPRLFDLKVQASTYGQSIPEAFGRARLAGNVIWSSDLIEVAHTSSQSQGGGKGGGGGSTVTTTTYSYHAHLAIGICAGAIAGVRKIWASGKLVYNAGDNADVATIFASNARSTGIRFYTGGATQTADPLIESYEGAGNVPGYRNLAYCVFEGFQLADFGNRIPNFEFEVLTAATKTRVAGAVSAASTFANPGWYTGNSSPALTHDGTAAIGSHLVTNARIDSNMVAEIMVFGLTSSTNLRTLIAKDINGALVDTETVNIPIPSDFTAYFNPAVFVPAGAAWCQGSERYLVTSGNGTAQPPVMWDLETQQMRVLGAASTSIVVAAARSGDHLYLKYGASAATASWYYVDLSQLLLSMTLLGAATTAGLPFADADNWYVHSGTTIKTYTHGTFTEEASVAHAATVYGLARVEGGFLAEPSGSLRFIDDDGTVTNLGATQARSGETYGAYGNGAWVTPYSTAQDTRIDYWYAVAGTAGSSPALSTVVQTLCTRAGLAAGDIDVTALTDSVTGYVRGKRGPLRAAIEPLMQAYFFDAVESDGKIKFVKRGAASAVTFDADDLDARAEGAQIGDIVSHERGQDLELPVEISVLFFNDTSGYEQGAQYARRLTSQAESRSTLELPLVLTDAQAKHIADAQLFDAWAARDGYSWRSGRAYAKYEPGDVATIPVDSDSTLEVRITKRDDGADGVIAWQGVYADASVYTQSASTQAAVAPDASFSAPGPTNLELMDIPLLRDQDDSYGFYAAVNGYLDDWRGAQLFRSADGGGTYDDLEGGTFLDEAVIGYAESVLGTVTLYDQFDEAGTVDVYLLNGTLASVTRDQVLNGSNVAVLGSEIIQFRTATLLSAGRYRLSGLLRARLGTDPAVGGHALNERFVLLDSSAVRFIAQGSADVAVERDFKAVSIGNTLASAGAEALTYAGVNLECLSPVSLGGGRDASGNLTINWKRRTRLSAIWRNYVDAPLGETTESYEVDVMNGSTVVRTIAAATNTASYTAAQQTTDFGSAQASISLRAYQLSSRVGRGYVATVTL